jgi:hypothetical protein
MSFTVHMNLFDLHHPGTQFFLGNVDIVFDPEIRQLHAPGGVSTPTAKKITLFHVHKKKQSVCGRCFNVHTRSSQCADVKYLTSTSVCPVCDLN